MVNAHPFEALALWSSKTTAEHQTVLKMGVNGLNDKSDAFRHAFFQSLNTVRIGSSLTQQFADAHETENPPQLQKEKEMDLFNNSVGIAHGKTLSPVFWTVSAIADAIYIKVTNGELMYLKPINFNDPDFWGTGGVGYPNTATHGITASTTLTPTNQ